jgi:hypothetical protein
MSFPGIRIEILTNFSVRTANLWSWFETHIPTPVMLITGIKYRIVRRTLRVCTALTGKRNLRIYKFSPYLTGNTSQFSYKDQPVNAVQENDSYLFWEPYRAQRIYSARRMQGSLMFDLVVYILTSDWTGCRNSFTTYVRSNVKKTARGGRERSRCLPSQITVFVLPRWRLYRTSLAFHTWYEGHAPRSTPTT